MNLSKLKPFLIYDFKSDADLLDAIEEISTKFTRQRDKISDYLKDERLISAYTAFYLLTNIPKLAEVLKWLPDDWINELKNSDFIDLGSGPGTFSLAWKEQEGISGDFYQIELSSLMKEQGRKIWKGVHATKLFQASKWEWNTHRPKFLLFGHSANEMGADMAVQYIDRINPEHLLFIEPGTKEFFPTMLKIRSHLLAQGYSILFPCPNHQKCPMANHEDDWCHQFVQIKQELEIERISQMARKDRKLLPLTVHAYSRTYVPQNPPERIVRVLTETKFSLEWEVCHKNVLEHYQVMKRDLSKQNSKEYGSLLSGQAIETELVKNLGLYKRVKMKSKR